MPDFVHGRATRVYVNGFDISMYLRSISAPITIEATETTTLVNNFKSYIPGMADATLSAEGLYEGSRDALNDIIEGTIQESEPSTWLVTHARTVGASCYGMACHTTSVTTETAAADLAMLNIEGQSTSFREQGVVVHPLGSEIGAGVGAQQDFGRDSPVGGAVYLQTLAPADGDITSDLAVAAQHSVDAITWVDLANLTAPATGKDAVRVDLHIPINRFTRASWAAGDNASAPFLMAVTRRAA